MTVKNFKITMLMAVSSNGMIADSNDQVPWSEPIWQNYFKLVKSTAALIVGRRTYDLMLTEDEVAKLGDIHIAVLSSSHQPNIEKIKFFANPEQVIDDFNRLGVARAILGGGPTVNELFLEKNMVDDMIFDTDPAFIPDGKPLFPNSAIMDEAKLIEERPLGGNCIRRHFQVRPKPA